MNFVEKLGILLYFIVDDLEVFMIGVSMIGVSGDMRKNVYHKTLGEMKIVCVCKSLIMRPLYQV